MKPIIPDLASLSTPSGFDKSDGATFTQNSNIDDTNFSTAGPKGRVRNRAWALGKPRSDEKKTGFKVKRVPRGGVPVSVCGNSVYSVDGLMLENGMISPLPETGGFGQNRETLSHAKPAAENRQVRAFLRAVAARDGA